MFSSAQDGLYCHHQPSRTLGCAHFCIQTAVNICGVVIPQGNTVFFFFFSPQCLFWLFLHLSLRIIPLLQFLPLAFAWWKKNKTVVIQFGLYLTLVGAAVARVRMLCFLLPSSGSKAFGVALGGSSAIVIGLPHPPAPRNKCNFRRVLDLQKNSKDRVPIYPVLRFPYY